MSSTVNSTTAPINGFFEWFGELGFFPGRFCGRQ